MPLTRLELTALALLGLGILSLVGLCARDWWHRRRCPICRLDGVRRRR